MWLVSCHVCYRKYIILQMQVCVLVYLLDFTWQVFISCSTHVTKQHCRRRSRRGSLNWAAGTVNLVFERSCPIWPQCASRFRRQASRLRLEKYRWLGCYGNGYCNGWFMMWSHSWFTWQMLKSDKWKPVGSCAYYMRCTLAGPPVFEVTVMMRK